jgi:hypothetical protein
MKAKKTAEFNLFLLVTGLLLASQALVSTSRAFSRDTVYLKHRSATGHNAVFIVASKSSPYYERFGYWQPDSLVVSQSQESWSAIPSNGFHHFQNQLRDLIGEWVEVDKYRNSFYLYAPCDGIFDSRMILSDSSLLYFNGANDFSLMMIDSVTFPKNGMVRLRLETEVSNTEVSTFTMTIKESHHEDRPSEFISSLKGYSSHMIPVEKVRRYPIIVNDCPDQKESEVEFDGKGGIRIR